MVWSVRALLAADRENVRITLSLVPVRLMVAKSKRASRGTHPSLPIPPEAGRPSMGERGLRALGTVDRLVQQHLVERGPTCLLAVPFEHRAIRVEPGQVLPLNCAHGALVLAARPTCSRHRSTPLGVCALCAHDVAQADCACDELCRELRM